MSQINNPKKLHLLVKIMEYQNLVNFSQRMNVKAWSQEIQLGIKNKKITIHEKHAAAQKKEKKKTKAHCKCSSLF